MGYRTLVVKNRVKLELSLGSLVIRTTEGSKSVSIDEINVLIIENTGCSITSALLSELILRKVRVIFCDSKHNPQFECSPYYGTNDSSLKVRQQVLWKDKTKNDVWAHIVKMKIENQAKMLKAIDATDSFNMLIEYTKDVKSGDITNREGHAAKVYFNTLFGVSFSRRQDTPTNAKLNYGYSLLLSMCSREIASLGYITQLGIHHDNQDNIFNLSCDLMEPFRPIVDSIVIRNYLDVDFDSEIKNKLIYSVMNAKVIVDNKVYNIDYATNVFIQSVVNSMEENHISLMKNFEYEY